MNSGRAKKIARLVYGDLSRKGAKYFRIPGTGQIVRDDLRRRYQHAKQRYKGMALWMIGAERKKSQRVKASCGRRT